MNVTQVIEALRREQRELDEQIKSIKERKAQIDVTISVLEGMNDQPSSPGPATSTPNEDQVQVTTEPLVTPHHGRDAGPQNSLRRLMQERPGQVFDSKAAYELLIADGWQSASEDPVNVVRSALAALASMKEVTKRSRGKYVYEPEQGAEPPGQGSSLITPSDQLNLTA